MLLEVILLQTVAGILVDLAREFFTFFTINWSESG